jgi:hypothetical protein
MAQEVEHLSSKCEAPSSNFSTTKIATIMINNNDTSHWVKAIDIM